MPSDLPPKEIRDYGQVYRGPRTPQMPLMYLHPVSLLFDLLAHAQSYLLPIVLGLFGAARGDVGWLIVSAILFVPAVASSVLRYMTLKYRIEDEHLVVDQGLIFQKTRTIPVSRIQNVDLKQNVLHRLFNVAEVQIETASGSEAEATLRVLSLQQVERLRAAIFFQRKTEQLASAEIVGQVGSVTDADQLPIAATGQSVAAVDPPSQRLPDQVVWQTPVGDLIKAGLASNRGLVLVGILFGVLFQFTDDGYKTIFNTVENFLPENDGAAGYYLQLSLMGLGALLLLRIMGVGWYLLRFYGHTVLQRGEDFRLSCGLLTKVSATVPQKRIQFISVQQNLIMRWMGIATIRIETAGGASDRSNPSESVSKSWFLPVLPLTKVPEVVRLLRPGFEWDAAVSYQGLSKRAANRMARFSIAITILMTLISGYLYWPWGLAVVWVLPLAILWARKKASSKKYGRAENYVVYRSGVLARKTSVTFFDRIQTISCGQSLFDRRWNMATLSIDTAAAGSAQHRIATAYLDEDFAFAEFDHLRAVAAGNDSPVMFSQPNDGAG